MVAALPVIAVGYKSDWSGFFEYPGARPEYLLGDAFIKANGRNIISLIVYARWACIPFNLIGAYFAYRWARELYCPRAGIVAMILYVFDPNLLAHSEMITPDGACTAFGLMAGYCFWRWLKRPAWTRTFLAGGALGVAELTKFSWLILFGLWPVVWCVWRTLEPRKSTAAATPLGNSEINLGSDGGVMVQISVSGKEVAALSDQVTHVPASIADGVYPPLSQLATILVLAIYLMNLGYGFKGTGTVLNEFEFVSTALAGEKSAEEAGNRFRDSWWGNVPIPLPKQYVIGLDCQKKDFEEYRRMSYLRGEVKNPGWWYYYIYGLLVKAPCGTWGLLIFVTISRLLQRDRSVPFRDEFVLLAPAVALLFVVSSQTKINIHLRYIFPILGFVMVYIGQAGSVLTRSSRVGAIAVCGLIAYSVTSALLVYPNHLSYFNDFVGGSSNGHKHLLGSSVDWGQGLGEAIDWIKINIPSSRIEFSMWTQGLAEVLWDTAAEADTASTLPRNEGVRYILYDADAFFRRQKEIRKSNNVAIDDESIVKQFPSGSVLVRKADVDSSASP